MWTELILDCKKAKGHVPVAENSSRSISNIKKCFSFSPFKMRISFYRFKAIVKYVIGDNSYSKCNSSHKTMFGKCSSASFKKRTELKVWKHSSKCLSKQSYASTVEPSTWHARDRNLCPVLRVLSGLEGFSKFKNGDIYKSCCLFCVV